jgi:hypothetical protein
MEAHRAISGGNPGVSHEDLHDQPALAAIVVTPDSYDTIRCLMECLKAQTVAGQIEVVLVGSSNREMAIDESNFSCFHSWHVVEVGKVKSLGAAYVEGIVRAEAPIVVLTHDHSFPDSDLGELLIAAHREPWAAVGPSIRNGNPDSMISWADFYVCYGEWAHPVPSGPVHCLPGHHSSYKREPLLASGTRLYTLMEDEYFLFRHLEAEGRRLLLESQTSSTHINLTSWSTWIPSRYYKGRQFAAIWAHMWPWPRRLLYALASPLIPLVRLWRIQKRVRRGRSWRFLVTLMPVVAAGLTAEWLGQVHGFLAGPGDSGDRFTQYEFGRLASAGSPNPHDAHDSPAK